MTRLEQIIRRLSPEKQKEVEDFAEFLAQHAPEEPVKMTQDWAGGLREWREQYTSTELQKKALEWWGD
jgi:hypothetical protein